MAIQQDISFFSGNDVLLELTALDEVSGAPIDFSGALEITWSIAKSARADALLTKTLSDGVAIVNAVAGRVDISLSKAEMEPLSGKYYHEIRYKNLGGKTVTLTFGVVEIQVNLIRS